MEKVDYDDRQHAVYAQGRAVSPAMIATWMTVFGRHAPARRPLTVLDLGSGTGRFTPALARSFRGPVYGVEPSQRMRQVAQQSAAHPGVTYLAGRAERIPLARGSCDVVLMYLVFHHVPDREAAAAGARDAKALARQLVLLCDGAGISAWMDHDPSAEHAARTVAAALVDVQVPA